VSGFAKLKGGRNKLFCAAFFLLGAVTTAVVFLFAKSLSPGFQALSSPAWIESPEIAALPDETGIVGPWGTLEVVKLPLANPDGNVPDAEALLRRPRWVFEQFTEEGLTRFLYSCNLGAVPTKMILNRVNWTTTPTGWAITPPESAIWFLQHRGRRQLYTALARTPANYAQCFPFHFPIGQFDVRLGASDLPPVQVSKIRRLTYTNDAHVCFADLEAARRVLRTDEFDQLVAILYEIPACRLRLRVAPEADVEAVARYWGRGGREKRILPLLQALERSPGGGEIHVADLLPSFARLRLNTYPDAWNDPTAARQDCCFTALNFFNETADTNLLNSDYAGQVLNEQYVPVEEKPTFGDLIMLVDAAGKAAHICVNIAGNYVFTKNGINAAQPWVLMNLSDMLMTYCPPGQRLQLLYLRRKDLAQPSGSSANML